MIWKVCLLQIVSGQAEDALGNPTGGQWQTVLETFARLTPWTDEQIALDERDVTRNEQRFIIPPTIPIRAADEPMLSVNPVISGVTSIGLAI